KRPALKREPPIGARRARRNPAETGQHVERSLIALQNFRTSIMASMVRLLPRVKSRLLVGLSVAGLLLSATSRTAYVQPNATFAARIAQLSERGGFFDTDNLISNERSYLHVVPALRDAGLTGGAYIGVGPD